MSVGVVVGACPSFFVFLWFPAVVCLGFVLGFFGLFFCCVVFPLGFVASWFVRLLFVVGFVFACCCLLWVLCSDRSCCLFAVWLLPFIYLPFKKKNIYI